MGITRYNEIVHLPSIELAHVNEFLMLCDDDKNCKANEFWLLASCSRFDEDSVNILLEEIEQKKSEGYEYSHYIVVRPEEGAYNYECML